MNRDKKKYIRKKLKKYAPWGCEWVLCGSLILLIWALGEFITRWDAADGLLKVIVNWVRQGKLTVLEAVRDIMDEPEARKDLLTLGFLGLGALMGLFGIVTHRLRTGLVTLLIGIAAALYDPYGAFWKRVLSYGLILKMAGALFMIAGSVLKLGSTLSAKHRLGLKYDKKYALKTPRRVPLDAHGNARTLIPERASRTESVPARHKKPEKKELVRR